MAGARPHDDQCSKKKLPRVRRNRATTQEQERCPASTLSLYRDMIFFEETAAVVIRFAPEPAADRVTV
jgi:hypothetical protein